MNKQIHIVSFDVPFPPDYGGVLDVYLRAKTLKQSGYFVILHCYEYGRGREHDFSQIADEIHYYNRKNGVRSVFSNLPYIVKSRNSEELLRRLLSDDAPILLEGQHSTFWINELIKNQKQVAIRMHNIEWHYYRDLAKEAKTTSERLFFGMESKKLKKQESRLKKVPLLCISESDQSYYNSLGFHAVYLPVTIHSDLVLEPIEGEQFALFHGNLSIGENLEAIHKLIAENRRKPLGIPVVIAGKNPGKQIISKIEREGWKCIANPSDAELDDLLRSCSVHLLIGFKSAGIKLKVIRALLSGKPCIATKEMVGNQTLEKYCELWNPAIPLSEQLERMHIPGEQEIRERLDELEAEFGVEKLESALREVGLSQ
ncbi:hypothetical protein D3C71_1080690 [compost metagenome]